MSLMSYGRHALNSVAILCNSFHLTSNGTPTEVVSGGFARVETAVSAFGSALLTRLLPQSRLRSLPLGLDISTSCDLLFA